MIKLFQSSDTSFSTNGDVVIKPLKAIVHKEDNGAFFFDLDAGIEYADFLKGGNILVAPIPQGEQAFRINNVQKTRYKVSLKAQHVFYDSKNLLIYDSNVVDKNCNAALDHLNRATDTASPFTTYSDVSKIGSFRCVRQSLAEAVDVLLERWGGHLVRDNFDIKILSDISHDNGMVVRYAKNMKEITFTENFENVVTKLLPVGKDGIMLNSVDSSADPYLYSSLTYDIPYTKTVSFNQDIKQEDYPSEAAYKAAVIADLRTQGQAYVDKHCIPELNYTLKANVETITDIGDVIEVIDQRLGINILTNLIAFDYNCITKKYASLEFGNYRVRNLSNLLANITGIVDTQIEKYLAGS